MNVKTIKISPETGQITIIVEEDGQHKIVKVRKGKLAEKVKALVNYKKFTDLIEECIKENKDVK